MYNALLDHAEEGYNMPIYDYHCGKCKKEFTVTRSISDRDKGVPACPKCKGKRQVSQLVSNFTAITSRKS